MTAEELNDLRRDGKIAYTENGKAVVKTPLSTTPTRIPLNVYPILKRECRYIQAEYPFLLNFCDVATAASGVPGIYVQGARIHLDDRWFTSKAELREYFSVTDTLDGENAEECIALLNKEPVPDDLLTQFEALTKCSLFTDGTRYRMCGVEFPTKESLIAYIQARDVKAFDYLKDKVQVFQYVQAGRGVILDGVAYVGISQNAMAAYTPEVAVKGFLSGKETIMWKSHDDKHFYSFKTDHGDVKVLETLKKDKLKAVFAKLIPTDILAKTMPYPVAVLPQGEYAFSYQGEMEPPAPKEVYRDR